MSEIMLIKGNEALAEGAIRGGCRFYAGYPITPQSEILEWMGKRQKKLVEYLYKRNQKIASVNMVFAARALGARALTSSSGPGFSLKQEGIAYWVSAESQELLRASNDMELVMALLVQDKIITGKP